MARSFPFLLVLRICFTLGLQEASEMPQPAHIPLVRAERPGSVATTTRPTAAAEHPGVGQCTEDPSFWTAVAAASGTSPSTASSVHGTKIRSFEETTCVNPSTDDPGQWACECQADMESHCDGIDEECFKDLMCDNTHVCQVWKNSHCVQTAQGLLESSSTDSLGARAKRNQGSIEGGLDGSVSGKCSQ